MSSASLPTLKLLNSQRVPLILQTEVAECGLACLAMVAGFHGFETDLNSLRRRFPVSTKGVTLAALMRIADRMNMAGRALKLDMSHLTELQTPCVLHWDMNHFVVLVSANAKTIVIHDPAFGEKQLTIAEAGKHFTGVALELRPTEAFERKEEVQKLNLLDFARGVVGLKPSLLQILFISLALQVFAILTPFYQQLVVDEVLASFDVDLLIVLAIGFGMLMLISAGTTFLRSWLILRLGNLFSFQMSVRLARHLFRLPLSWFEKRHIGDVVSRFGSLQEVQRQLTSGLVGAVVDGLMALITAAMMFVYSPKLAAVVLVSVLLYGLIRWATYGASRRLAEQLIVADAKENSHFMETIRAMPSVRVFGHEPERLQGWQHKLADQFNAGIQVGKFNLAFTTANEVLFGLQNILVIYLGAKLAMENVFSVGMLFAFLSYKTQFSDRAAALINQWISLRMLDLHLARLADIALTETEADLDGQMVETPLAGGLSAQNLGFRYSESEPWVFRGLSFNVNAGESVAIIGPSGCGKTTLVKMLMGLVAQEEGEVKADGYDIRTMGLGHYRSQIAAVLQDDQLLSGSLIDNISFFNPQPDLERVMACAHTAGVHEEVMAMPMNYQTLVGDMGSSLSGGQKQRILLARALYRQPKILFLDEATSHLDVALELRVNEAIKHLNITRIIIAHRLETIRSADRVIDLFAMKQNATANPLATQQEVLQPA
ncbi:peptidase domain-containing ABC transporter [Chitinimonas sp. PSY-7]|uniref:ABC transporter transmembrane domain-containing protein n=1 Tax=Chitinimonas sp. PSY-7 TaxID=3459088 RepID=UPI00403FEF20